MNACDFRAVVIDCNIYCLECAPVHKADEAFPIFANSEWDSYPYCTRCGREHDYVIKIEDKHTPTDPDDMGIGRCPVCSQRPDEFYAFDDAADDNEIPWLRKVTPCEHCYVIDCINGWGVFTNSDDTFVIGLDDRGVRLTYAESLRDLP